MICTQVELKICYLMTMIREGNFNLIWPSVVKSFTIGLGREKMRGAGANVFKCDLIMLYIV